MTLTNGDKEYDVYKHPLSENEIIDAEDLKELFVITNGIITELKKNE